MVRHALRILRHDLAGWVPMIVVVMLVTVLIGTCMSQFIWTGSGPFTTAARQAGLDPAEFSVVSATIYMFVALLAFFSLTVVGSAAVECTRDTFARWRLAGASPAQVRRTLWIVVGLVSLAGALPGSLISLPVSALAVPVFNRMAGDSFPDGLGSFDPPAFQPSAAAWGGALVLGAATCLLGALLPAQRASRIEAVEALREPARSGRRGAWLRWAAGGCILAVAIAEALAGAAIPVSGGFGARAGAMVNAAMTAGLTAAVGVYVIGPQLVSIVLGLGRAVLELGHVRLGVIAARSARAGIGSNANTIAPLATAIGLTASVLTSLRSYAATLAAAGFALGGLNYSDTFVMSGLIAFVSLLTSVSVIVLSRGDLCRDLALLRTAGMSPRQMGGWCVWQSGMLAACAVVLGLIPVAVASAAVGVWPMPVVGRGVLDIPWIGIGAAGLVCWAVLFAAQWLQLRPILHREPAAELRRTA
jgi:putative ABC transport system permease protein